MKEILSFLGEGFLDLIYPSNIYCVSCGNLIDDTRPYALCDTCVRALEWANGRTCARCGRILQESYGPELCTGCAAATHIFAKGFACVEYGSAERDMILRFKYKDQAYLGRKMADMMYDRICAEELEADLVLPVPMFRKKEKQRGYNQAALLAAGLAKRMGIPFDRKLLIRAVETEVMNKLNAVERKKNVQGAFAVSQNGQSALTGRRVILVDDIYTTGSTVDACAETLLAAGARKVFVFAFASAANFDTEPDEVIGSV